MLGFILGSQKINMAFLIDHFLQWSENDDKMVEDYVAAIKEMFEKAGFINIKAEDTNHHPDPIYMKWGSKNGHDPKALLA